MKSNYCEVSAITHVKRAVGNKLGNLLAYSDNYTPESTGLNPFNLISTVFTITNSTKRTKRYKVQVYYIGHKSTYL